MSMSTFWKCLHCDHDLHPLLTLTFELWVVQIWRVQLISQYNMHMTEGSSTCKWLIYNYEMPNLDSDMDKGVI